MTNLYKSHVNTGLAPFKVDCPYEIGAMNLHGFAI